MKGITSMTRARSSPKRLLVSARMVPDSRTWSGITLGAPGPAPQFDLLSCLNNPLAPGACGIVQWANE